MIKIVVDSGCDVNDKMRNEYKIEVVPLTVQIDESSFFDDENFDVENLMAKMEQGSDVKSAVPSPKAFLESFKGDESVFTVAINSVLSGSYNSASLAKKMYFEEVGQKFIHIFDSKGLSICETVIALKINELANLNLPDSEIVDDVNKFIEQQKFFFILERFDNLVKTGRMSPVIAKIATFLNVYPICTVNRDTLKIEMFDKARGFKKSLNKLITTLESENHNFEDRILGITHVKCIDRANYVKDELLKKFKFKDVIILESMGVSTMYADKGGILISF